MTSTRLLVHALIVVVLGTGCAGPMALRQSRQKYNEAVQQTTAEQLLLNLVRLRYRDTPSFMELTSLSTQFAFEEAASLDVSIPEAALDRLGLGAAFTASERPTVTYDPLHGQDFVARLMSPLKEETIILLIRSGWSIERVLRMTVQDLNGIENARRASGPTPATISQEEFQKFQDVVATLRDLQIANKVRIGYEESVQQLSGSIPSEYLSATAFVEAAQQGWKLQPKQERVSIKTEKIDASSDAAADYLDTTLFANLVSAVQAGTAREPVLVMWRESWERRYGRKPGLRLFEEIESSPEGQVERLPDAKNTHELRPFVAVEGEHGDLLLAAYRKAGIDRIPCIVEYPNDFVLTGSTQSLVMNWDTEVLGASAEKLINLKLPGLKEIEQQKYTLNLEPRSLIGVLYYLSHAICVPPEDQMCGLVSTTDDEEGNEFDWATLTGDLLTVNWSRKKPKCAAVAIKYRDVWFYIDDRDSESKSTFTLLTGLFELQAGGGATGTKPVLTLPVGI